MSDRREPHTDGEHDGSGARERADAGNEFQRAVGRLEAAVEDLVGSARDQLSESAIQIIEETAERLRGRPADRSGGSDRADGFEDGYMAEDGLNTDGDADGSSSRSRSSRSNGRSSSRSSSRSSRKEDRWQRRQARWAERQARRHSRWQRQWDSWGQGSWWGGGRPRLTRNRRDVWMGGVCSGLARHFEMESWVVRVIAVSLLLFTPMTMLVFCAYIGAWIFLPDGPDERVEDRAGKARRGSDAEPGRAPDPDRHRASAAPELGPRFSPRRSLREVRAQFDTVELKIRRMESFVTSPRFELERELARMDGAS